MKKLLTFVAVLLLAMPATSKTSENDVIGKSNIKLTSRIHLKRDTTLSRRMSRKADGVKFIIQHNTFIQDSGRIDANRTDTIRTIYNSISVQAHDVFFFRLSANKDRRFDNTEWEQTIEYLTGNADVYQSAEDYVCTGDNVFVAEDVLTGRVRFSNQKIAVIGGGLTGMETAEYLQVNGNEVVDVEMMDAMGAVGFPLMIMDATSSLAKQEAKAQAQACKNCNNS